MEKDLISATMSVSNIKQQDDKLLDTAYYDPRFFQAYYDNSWSFYHIEKLGHSKNSNMWLYTRLFYALFTSSISSCEAQWHYNGHLSLKQR